MQGYVARDGFGITLIKNQIVAAIERIKNPNLPEPHLLFFILLKIFCMKSYLIIYHYINYLT
jgi:hypothetical protein